MKRNMGMKKLNSFDKFIIAFVLLSLVVLIGFLAYTNKMDMEYVFEADFPTDAKISAGDVIYVDFEKLGKIGKIEVSESYTISQDLQKGGFVKIPNEGYKKYRIICQKTKKQDVLAGDRVKITINGYMAEGLCISSRKIR